MPLAYAQDRLPAALLPAPALPAMPELPPFHVPGRQIAVGNSMPADFEHTVPNRIEDVDASLFPFFEKLKRGQEPVRVVHLGDSHVRGHVMTRVVRRNFERDFGAQAVYPDTISYFTGGIARETGLPGIVYHAIGINGATTAHFANAPQIDEIARLQPDLLILSFGTNESHGRNYTPTWHRQEMNTLIDMLRQACPRASILLTTPPASYVRRRRTRIVNTRTALVAQTMVDYARDKGYAVWDVYTIAGGKKQAALNWANHHYMLRDKVHYNQAGYSLQGNLLYEAIIKAYNEYVAN